MFGWIVCRAGWLERCQLHPPTVGHLCCNFIGTQLQQWDTITIMGRQNKSTGAPTLLDKNQGIHFGSVVCFDLIRGCDRYTGANCNQIYSDLHKSEIAQQFMIKTHSWNINMIRGN